MRYSKKAQGSGWSWARHIIDEISGDDPALYKFKLRDEAWRNSPSITSEDVAFSFERILGRQGGPSDAGNRSIWRALKKVEVIDPRSASIELSAKRPDLLTTVLPGIAGCVVNKAHVGTLSGGRFKLDPGPTSGRYDLCAVDPYTHAKLVADQNWQGDKVQIDSAAFVVIQDDNAAKEMWLAGEIDVYRPGIDVLRQVAQQRQPILKTPTSRTRVLVLNQNSGPLENPELRRAVQLAVDRKAVGQSAFADDDPVVATGLIPRGWTGWSEKELAQYNPDEAQRLATSNQPSDMLRIATRADSLSIGIGEHVRSDLEKVGLQSVVIPREPTPYWLAIAENEADILVTVTLPQTFGSMAAFEYYTSASPTRWFQNAQFDSQYQIAEMDPTHDILSSMQQLLVSQDIVVPLIDERASYLVRDNIAPEFDPDGGVGDLGSWSLI